MNKSLRDLLNNYNDFKEEKRMNELTIFEENFKDFYNVLGKGAKDKKWFEYLFDKVEWKRKIVFGHMIHILISHIEVNVQSEHFKDDLLKYNVSFRKKSGEENSQSEKAVKALKDLIKEKVIRSQEVQSVVFGGMMTIMQLFDAIKANPDKLLPEFYRGRMDKYGIHRCVCDYISGMTDTYARRLHDRIYGNEPRSVFEEL